jgi:ankyrin repeat protein
MIARGWMGAALGLAATLAGPLAYAEPARPAPRADCGASQGVEKAICSDPRLAARDRRIWAYFAEARREAEPHAEELLQEKDDWRTALAGCVSDSPEDQATCISSADYTYAQVFLGQMPRITPRRIYELFRGMTPDELEQLTTDENSEVLASLSCKFFRAFPHEASVLFAANSYSSRDGWVPICRDVDITEQVPATARLLHVLQVIAGEETRCDGTMRFGVYRTQRVARILAVVEAAPDYAGDRQRRAHQDDELPYHPDVAHWALQGRWEQRRHADLLAAAAVARPAMAADYARRWKLDPARAARLADYHIQRLIDVYTRRSGGSSTLDYGSLCLGLPDLDAYLRTGALPAKECPYQELAEPGDAATRRRLLGLAIVNGYPLEAVARLLAAGASQGPPATSQERRQETLLMLAAGRPRIVAALLAAGADPNRANPFGKTALMYAVQEKDEESVRRLLAGGAKVDAATTAADSCTALAATGRTALMYAAWHGTPEIVSALLAAHADPRLADSNGKTAAAYLPANRSLSLPARNAMTRLLAEPPPGGGK